MSFPLDVCEIQVMYTILDVVSPKQQPTEINNSYSVIVLVRVVLKRSVVDDFGSGCRNVSHQQQFVSELPSPGRSHYANY